METRADTATLELIESVRCLECAAIYAKPSAGGTVAANPGCPECGYLGWLPLTLPFERARAQHPLAPVTPLHS